MIPIRSKALLVQKMQEWLDDDLVADELGSVTGMWQDTTAQKRNANLMADAVELVVRSTSLQSTLELENT